MTGKRTGREIMEEGGLPLEEKVAFLSSVASHHGVEDVKVKETRMSWVFMAGNRVYKLKKPVRYPYLDYSTPEKRRQVCSQLFQQGRWAWR